MKSNVLGFSNAMKMIVKIENRNNSLYTGNGVEQTGMISRLFSNARYTFANV